MSDSRFFVDIRGGCVAVRDRTLTDPEYQGLHEDTAGVVFYRHGYINPVKPCVLCGHSLKGEWTVAPGDITEAYLECERLNALDISQKETVK